MKKLISILAIAAVAALAFVSCNKNDGNDDGNGKGPAASYVEMDFWFYAKGAPFGNGFAAQVITYEAGDEKNTEEAGSAAWHKSEPFKVKLPCTLKFARSFLVKLPQYFNLGGTFSYTLSYDGSYKLLDADGNTIEGSEKTFEEVELTVNDEPDNITAEKINNGTMDSEIIFRFDKDGNLVK